MAAVRAGLDLDPRLPIPHCLMGIDGIHFEVDRRRADVRVPEEPTHAVEGHALPHQLDGVAVAEEMGMHAESDPAAETLKNALHRPHGDPPGALVGGALSADE